MSVSPLVPLLISACLVLPVLIIAAFYRLHIPKPDEAAARSMDTAMKGLRADILQIDYSAETQNWRSEDWDGPDARVRARVTDASHEVIVLTPYAEASVEVGVGTENERRRCSLCLN
jgi:hypothetical protein